MVEGRPQGWGLDTEDNRRLLLVRLFQVDQGERASFSFGEPAYRQIYSLPESLPVDIFDGVRIGGGDFAECR